MKTIFQEMIDILTGLVFKYYKDEEKTKALSIVIKLLVKEYKK